jgi:hypothetical protein
LVEATNLNDELLSGFDKVFVESVKDFFGC